MCLENSFRSLCHISKTSSTKAEKPSGWLDSTPHEFKVFGKCIKITRPYVWYFILEGRKTIALNYCLMGNQGLSYDIFLSYFLSFDYNFVSFSTSSRAGFPKLGFANPCGLMRELQGVCNKWLNLNIVFILKCIYIIITLNKWVLLNYWNIKLKSKIL